MSGTEALGFASIETLQADIQRIGEIGKGALFPGDNFGIVPHPDPVRLSLRFQLQADVSQSL